MNNYIDKEKLLNYLTERYNHWKVLTQSSEQIDNKWVVSNVSQLIFNNLIGEIKTNKFDVEIPNE